ncbi:MAG TPA: hypothetical protein VHD56_18620 [Tepidisphaeraceae bacterium]|nr:hypothetical protein [Tepidisphaeraceae bacterium]
MRLSKLWACLTCAAFLVSAKAFAQPATAPKAPATTARARHAITIPPGFHVIEVNQRQLIVEPADETWLRPLVASLKPTTMPTTMPSDLIGQITASRDKLKQRLTTDLALSDASLAETFLKDHLEESLKKYHEIVPPLFYMVVSEKRLAELYRGGWSDPRFYYNRVSDSVIINSQLDLTADGMADDVLLPALYKKDGTPDEQHSQVEDEIRSTESKLASAISLQAMRECHEAFLQFALLQTITPLKGRPDREWFSVGVAEVLGCHYTSMVTGLPLPELIRQITVDDPRMPVSQASVDLAHPVEAGQLRPQMGPAYVTAYRKKSARIINNWIGRVGIDMVPKVLVEMRKSPPADGAAMLKQIQQVSGVDLSADVQAGR